VARQQSINDFGDALFSAAQYCGAPLDINISGGDFLG